MRETIGDWKSEWIETNGQTDELEVLIKDTKQDENSPCVYEGSFTGIPEELLDRKVIESWQILASSDPERVGAYSLNISNN